VCFEEGRSYREFWIRYYLYLEFFFFIDALFVCKHRNVEYATHANTSLRLPVGDAPMSREALIEMENSPIRCQDGYTRMERISVWLFGMYFVDGFVCACVSSGDLSICAY
jgi:hypothetical protein